VKKSEDLKEVGVDGKIILKWILKKQDRRAWIGFNFLARIGASFRTLRIGYELPGAIMFG
jgi:hypothetical protein